MRVIIRIHVKMHLIGQPKTSVPWQKIPQLQSLTVEYKSLHKCFNDRPAPIVCQPTRYLPIMPDDVPSTWKIFPGRGNWTFSNVFVSPAFRGGSHCTNYFREAFLFQLNCGTFRYITLHKRVYISPYTTKRHRLTLLCVRKSVRYFPSLPIRETFLYHFPAIAD